MRGKPIRDLHLLNCVTGDLGIAGVAKPGQRDPSIKGLGSAGLRRLSRRGSWVRIPPPAPKTNTPKLFVPFGLLSLPLWHTGTTQKLYEFIFRILFLSRGNPRLFFRDGFVIGLSRISGSPWTPRVISVEIYALKSPAWNRDLG